MKHLALLPALLLMLTNHTQGATDAPFTPDWDSLSRFECPEWFRDAKFGIYAHWGPYAVPGYSGHSDWYSHWMYVKGRPERAFQEEHYGPVSKIGYKDFVPLFTAPKFDAEAWADLYVEAGARFAGPVAEHADGFAMYASNVTPWNAAIMGPKRDIVAALEQAIRKRGLKFMVSFHHIWNYGWYPTWDDETDCADPRYIALYGPKVPPTAWKKTSFHDVDPLPDNTVCQIWLAKVAEVVHRHAPDLLWFDSRLSIIAERYRLSMAADYYNTMASAGRPGLITYKNEDLRPTVGVLDLERSRKAELHPLPWLTDTSIAKNSWGYTSDLDYYSSDRLVDDLVDIVSKNGCLLLNIAPHPDGTIPDEQQKTLREIGAWLRLNGEAIYGTRPWTIFGEGPTVVVEGRFSDRKLKGFTAEDVRFTRSKDGRTLYAIILGWPEKKDFSIQSLADTGSSEAPKIASISMIGHDGKLHWTRDGDGLHVRLPDTPPCDAAVVLKLSLESSSARSVALAAIGDR